MSQQEVINEAMSIMFSAIFRFTLRVLNLHLQFSYLIKLVFLRLCDRSLEPSQLTLEPFKIELVCFKILVYCLNAHLAISLIFVMINRHLSQLTTYLIVTSNLIFNKDL